MNGEILLPIPPAFFNGYEDFQTIDVHSIFMIS